MTEAEFKAKTKAIALRVIRLVEALPKRHAAGVIGRQVLRSATSMGANYRAACRAQSTRDMIAKLRDVEEEADESLYWLELLGESGVVKPARLEPLAKEVESVLKMTVASLKTLQRNQSKTSNQKPKTEGLGSQTRGSGSQYNG